MWRKVALTGLISVVAPGSLQQVVIASTISLGFLVMHARCRTCAPPPPLAAGPPPPFAPARTRAVHLDSVPAPACGMRTAVGHDWRGKGALAPA